jgi:hypothetical protein
MEMAALATLPQRKGHWKLLNRRLDGPQDCYVCSKETNFLPVLGVISQYLGLSHPGDSLDTTVTEMLQVPRFVWGGGERVRKSSYLPHTQTPAQDELLEVMHTFHGSITPTTIPQLQNCKRLIVTTPGIKLYLRSVAVFNCCLFKSVWNWYSFAGFWKFPFTPLAAKEI